MNQKEYKDTNSEDLSWRPEITLIPGERSIDESFEFGKILEDRGFSFSIDSSDEEMMPVIKVGHNFFYHGIPRERELSPFLEYLNKTVDLTVGLRKKVSLLESSRRIDLYLSPACTFCPGVVRKITPLTYYTSNIELHLIDVSRFESLAEMKKIRSVPTTIVMDRLRFTGDLNLEDFVSTILTDLSEPDFNSLKKMVDSGNATFIADAMIADGRIYSSFVQLLTHPEWSVRIGAMVAMEELINRDRPLARSIVGSLKKVYYEKDETVKGDILYIVGEVGDIEYIQWLKSVIESERHPEVVDAAEAAMDEILSREDRLS